MKLRGYGVLQIEPTDLCNLNCKMCKPHAEKWDSIHSIVKGYLDVGLWRKIVQNFRAETITWDHIIFQWLGDPLLHPEIDRLIEITAEEIGGQVGYLRIDSNMIALDERRMLRLLDVSQRTNTPILMVASLDAASEEVYQKVKGQPRLRLVQENLRRFLRYRNKLRAPINLQVQFVVQKENAMEAKDFLEYWLDLLRCQGGELWHDEILFKRLSVDGGGEGQAEADRIYQRHILDEGIRERKQNGIQIHVWETRPWQQDDEHQAMRTACPGLWMTPVIRHDGHLMMCCADLQGEMNLGSLQQNSFLQLWNGSRARELRAQHLAGTFQGVCEGCGGINWYQLPENPASTIESKCDDRSNRELG